MCPWSCSQFSTRYPSGIFSRNPASINASSSSPRLPVQPRAVSSISVECSASRPSRGDSRDARHQRRMGKAADLPPNRNINFRILLSLSKKSIGTTTQAIRLQNGDALQRACGSPHSPSFWLKPVGPTVPVSSNFCFRKLETRQQLLKEFRVLEMLQPGNRFSLIGRGGLTMR